jgi:hypothetical protein
MLTVFVVPRYFLFPRKLSPVVLFWNITHRWTRVRCHFLLMFKSDLSVSIFEEPQHVWILINTFISLDIWQTWRLYGSLAISVVFRFRHSLVYSIEEWQGHAKTPCVVKKYKGGWNEKFKVRKNIETLLLATSYQRVEEHVLLMVAVDIFWKTTKLYPTYLNLRGWTFVKVVI